MLNLVLKEMALSSGSDSCSEDRVGMSGNVGWVIDGATQLEPGNLLPSPSEGTWISELLQAELGQICASKYTGALVTLVEHLAKAVQDKLAALSFPTERTPPLASLGLVRLGEGVVDVALLGDVTVVIRNENAVQRFTDKRFLANEQLVATPRSSRPSSNDDLKNSILQRRENYVKGLGGPVVLSANPEAVQGCLQASCSIQSGDHILLASDGFMRLLDVYQELSSIEELLKIAEGSGIRELLVRLRTREKKPDVHREQASILKPKDDATALLLGVTQ